VWKLHFQRIWIIFIEIRKQLYDFRLPNFSFLTSDPIERPNGFRVEFLCHSADNAIKDRIMQGLSDLNMKYGEERIFDDINGIFSNYSYFILP
jgi:hypothetical protein